MGIIILGKPLFIWFGILSVVCLLLTAFFGFRMRKYGLKPHKIFFYLTMLFAFLHLAFGAWGWL